MNSLKNLMIIGVLAAVGYGVYVSLSRNNVESEQPFGASKMELASAKSPGPRGLPLGGNPVSPAGASGFASGGLTPPPLGSANPPGVASNTGAAAPYPSSASNSLIPPAIAPSAPPAGLTSNPAGTLGGPIASDALPSAAASNGAGIAAAGPTLPSETANVPPGGVRNLAPPPAATAGVTATAVAAPSRDAAKSSDNSLQNTFNEFMDTTVRKNLEEQKFADVHLALSGLYGDPNLPAEQKKQITDLLDQLASKVIYSREHLLAPAYVVQPGDTIDAIAQKYSVPWQLLAKINGLMPPTASNADNTIRDQQLPSGTLLKVLQGPFDAVVQLDKRELTLMVQNRYAARFQIGVGRDQPTLEGKYTVRNKTLNPTYYGPDGTNVAAGDPKNPLGSAWIELNDRIGIHGTADPQSIGRDNNRGAICVGDKDLQDLYGILSVGSRVTILK